MGCEPTAIHVASARNEARHARLRAQHLLLRVHNMPPTHLEVRIAQERELFRAEVPLYTQRATVAAARGGVVEDAVNASQQRLRLRRRQLHVVLDPDALARRRAAVVHDEHGRVRRAAARVGPRQRVQERVAAHASGGEVGLVGLVGQGYGRPRLMLKEEVLSEHRSAG